MNSLTLKNQKAVINFGPYHLQVSYMETILDQNKKLFDS